MAEFKDFRVVLSPNIQMRGTWSVQLDECPIAALTGPKGSVQPCITRQQLSRLRSRHGWPDRNELKAIGEKVWESLMTPDLRAAFTTCLAMDADRGMRLIVSMTGEEPEAVDPEKISFRELPLEALYSPQQNFLAPNPFTPVSRSLKFRPDRDPLHIPLPLRVLVVVATPSDKPPANMQEEKAFIEEALKGLSGLSGAIESEFCDPPTRSELTARLQRKRFHILHFIGHGAYDSIGEDPSLRPHLCLQNDRGESDAMDADTLDLLLQNSGVRLVVITACASGQPTPDEVQSTVGPFDGIAQRLVSSGSGVSAVVAMQFDLESRAAVTFSKTLYTHLRASGRKLDEIVTLCRQALVGVMDIGHRAWVTPVLYWRCKNGKVFELEPARRVLDEKIQRELNVTDAIVEEYLKNIEAVKSEPPDVQDVAARLVAKWRQRVDELLQKKDHLLGETLRLRGGQIQAGQAIECLLVLRLRTPAVIGDVQARVRFPEDKVVFRRPAAGAKAVGSAPLVGFPAAGELTLLLPNVSQGDQWAPGEFEVARLDFQVEPGVTDPTIELSMLDAQMQKDGVVTPIESLDAILFLT